jgi:integral membrane protein
MPVTEQTGADDLQADPGVRAALRRYRYLAYVVGVGLLVLVFVGVPLQYGANVPQVAEVVGPIHGALYIVYLATAVDLARRSDLTTRQLFAIVLAGFVPFVAFVVERRISASVQSGLDDAGVSPESPR